MQLRARFTINIRTGHSVSAPLAGQLSLNDVIDVYDDKVVIDGIHDWVQLIDGRWVAWGETDGARYFEQLDAPIPPPDPDPVPPPENCALELGLQGERLESGEWVYDSGLIVKHPESGIRLDFVCFQSGNEYRFFVMGSGADKLVIEAS